MYCFGLFLAACVFEVKSLNWVASVVSAALMFILFAPTRLNWVLSVGACLVQFVRNPLSSWNFDESLWPCVLKIIAFGSCVILGYCCFDCVFEIKT